MQISFFPLKNILCCVENLKNAKKGILGTQMNQLSFCFIFFSEHNSLVQHPRAYSEWQRLNTFSPMNENVAEALRLPREHLRHCFNAQSFWILHVPS